jgi:hypothetical protein
MIIRFVHRYLAPEESLLELLFGLIMALTMTIGARLFWDEGDSNVAGLVVALLGCNAAWGVIDAMFYLIGARFGRNVRLNLARRVQNARDHESALALIEAEVDLDASVLTDARDRAALRTLLLRTLKRANAAPRRNTSDEMLAAGIVCGLVTGAALPGVLPLLLLDDVTTAIGVANGLQIALLVWVGYRWAGFAGAPRWRTGLAVAATASGLVAIAVALGG